LQVLASYNLRATFFVNGEFIRRYPASLAAILEAGHDCASMFFTPADLSADGFSITEEFIKRGLARNEDEFFSATGRELSLLWHTPGYATSAEIQKAGAEAGYTWIKPQHITPDSVTLEQSIAKKIPYYAASDIVESLVRILGDGTIIPVSVGIASGTRNDYLYEKLDILIASILDAAFDIVPVEQL
jgi:peptidoglycan/xylan/chitin deacetylase (PgdA/CDA1 family)